MVYFEALERLIVPVRPRRLTFTQLLRLRSIDVVMDLLYTLAHSLRRSVNPIALGAAESA